VQDIRWRAFWFGFVLIFISLVIWAMDNAITALSVFAVGSVLYLISHLYWLHRLLKWFKNPELAFMPVGLGAWEEVFAAIYHEQRLHNRSQTQLTSALDRFRHAASALPDGVVLLNGNDQIEWCNPKAEKQLGLSMKTDAGQQISYLVRHTSFIEYLQAQHYPEPIKLESLRQPGTTLEIQIVPFGLNQKLLLCRDISQLEKLEHMRRDFIANVSHELRTPLTVVGGFIETLIDMDGAIPDSTRGYFAMMQEQTGRMRHLIEDLLTLSQLENAQTMPEDSEIDVVALLHMVMHEGQSLSNGKHTLTLEADSTLGLIGATEELHSAFGNLVSNAIRYTPEGGEIHIFWKSRGPYGIFGVRDNGIGIDQKHIDRLTERFYRVDRSRSRETGGTGLGLSIVKHILTRHQARLEIESDLGNGSTFSAVFPKERLTHKQTALFQ